MPKIVIEEKDNTTPGVLDENFDVVYIPGFVNPTAFTEEEAKEEASTGKKPLRLEPHVPTLFTSLSSFTTLCGPAPATFKTKQDYRTLNTDTTVGFSEDAVPFDNVMFNAGDADPSYIMAKELLAAGLNVIYERVNEDAVVSTTKIELKSLEDLEEGESYKIDLPAVKPISSSVPPMIYQEINKNYVVGKSDNPTFYAITSPVNMSGVDVTDPSVVYTAVEVTASDKTKYKLEEVTIDGKSELCITPNSTLYTMPVEYFAADAAATATSIPLVLSADGEIVTEDIPAISTSPITQYPKDWQSAYYKKYYQRTVVEDTITVTSTDIAFTNKTIQTLIKPTTGTIIGQLTAEDIIAKDVSVCYTFEDSITIANMYKALAAIFDSSNVDGIIDRGNFSIKYLTSGGYPVYEYNNNNLVTAMLGVAYTRGDCVAIIDHTDNRYRETNVDRAGSLYQSVAQSPTFDDNGEFGTMFTPWCEFSRTTSDREGKEVVSDGSIRLGGSFAYLGALADSIKTNAPWLAIAGATRGKVRNLSANGITTVIPNGAADFMQPRSNSTSVNAITDIKPYGNVIWGNRTLKRNDDNLIATSFLNIRNLVSDVKKVCYRTARKLTFEQNNDILWVNFKSMIAPTLDRMVSGYGISGYKFVRDTEHPKAAAKATLCAKIFLYPVEPVEDFYITIMLEDDEVTVQ